MKNLRGLQQYAKDPDRPRKPKRSTKSDFYEQGYQDGLRARPVEAKAAAGEPPVRPAEFAVPDTIAERVDRVLRESRLTIREYLRKESANLKPVDQNQIYGACPAPSASTEGLRETLRAEIDRLAIHSISVGPLNGPMKPERAILLDWALKAVDVALCGEEE